MNKKLYIALLCLFLSIEAVLYFFIFHAPSNAVNIISYISIVIVFLFGLIFIKSKKFNYIISIALFFTLISDYFLVLNCPASEIYKSVAMTTFSAAQLIYFAYILLQSKSKKLKIANVILRIILSIIMTIITVIVCAENVNYLAIISVFYYTNIALNLVFSLIEFRQFNILAIGLILFVLCDTVIGLNSAIGVFISVPETSILYKIAFAPFNLSWIFYLPSQVLIAIYQSLKNKKELTN